MKPVYFFLAILGLASGKKNITITDPDFSLLSNETYWKEWKPPIPSKTIWRTENRKILRNNEPFYIKGVNLNGIESNCIAPLGLWDNTIAYYLDFMQDNKFNSLRLPVSYEVMADLNKPIGQCVNADHNLRGGMPVGDLIQYILDESMKRKIYVLVDLHTIGGTITPDPWTSSVSEEMVITAWVNFMIRFGKHPALFAIEIKNEPHGLISMNEFTTHCAKVIYNIMNNVPEYQGLFVISGVEYHGSAWGGSFGSDKPSSSFQGLDHPNGLCLVGLVDRYVLNPHVYGTSVRGEGVIWEAHKENPAWESFYGFLSESDSHWRNAVILVTEYGGFMKEGSTDRAYYEAWLKWHLGKGYTAGGYHWTFNGEFSGDTGGLIEKGKVNDYKVDFCNRLTPNPSF